MSERGADWPGFVMIIIYRSLLSLGIWKLGEIVLWFFTNIRIGWGK